MLIDWFTVAAQIVNFLLIVWLLKRFLFGRIVHAIDARESKIAASLADAAAKLKQAEQDRAICAAQLQSVEATHDRLLAEARAQAGKKHAELIEQAREEVRAVEAKWREDLERERGAFLAELRRRAAAEILVLTRRALADLACIDAQVCAAKVFLEKIRLLDDESWKRLAGGDLILRSEFDLPQELRKEIEQTLSKHLPSLETLRFERTASIGLGLELRSDGKRIGWNSETYLENLEHDLEEAFETHPELSAPVRQTWTRAASSSQ